jgi:hypothetical protein
MATGPEHRRQLIARRWAGLLGASDAAQHPLYTELAELARHEPLLTELILAAPEDQQRPNLLLAALHDLALAAPDGPLAPWYPTARWLAATGGLDAEPAEPPPSSPLPEGAGSAVVRFLTAEREAVVELLRTRATQTNEVGRCAPLLYGLSKLRPSDAPVALVDLGASAGLNLACDAYRVELGPFHLGPPGSPVVLRTELRGEVDEPIVAPRIAWRRGLDRTPLVPSRDEDARWLLACQWPDDLERFERTRRALRLARRDGGVEVVAGDVVEDLAAVVEPAPAGDRLVLFHSWVAAYLTAQRQTQLADAVRQLGEERPVSWLFLEHPREVSGLEIPLLATERIPGSSLLVLVDEERRARVLAQCHPHGTWLRPDA